MWHAIADFLLRLHAQGLGHEAVIEIMIALLGVMVTVLGLLVAIFGFFGYTAIRDEAIRRAVGRAEIVAKRAAEKALKGALRGSDAAGYAESQRQISGKKKSGVPKMGASASISPAKSTRKRRATSDSNLTQDDEE